MCIRDSIETIRGINDSQPSRSTRTVKKYTDGGWLTISSTEGYNLSLIHISRARCWWNETDNHLTFLSVIFWGWVWGPIGMLLAVPITMPVSYTHLDVYKRQVLYPSVLLMVSQPPSVYFFTVRVLREGWELSLIHIF